MSKSKQIGLQLKALRKAANLTQKQCAESMGVDNTYISHIERGRNISLDVLQSYCKVLGVDYQVKFTSF